MTPRTRAFTIDRTIVGHAASVFGSTVATAGLGFAYAWLGARLFEKEAFGIASAGVGAMMLLSGLSLFGLTTLLVGELPRDRARAPRLLTAALLASGALGAVLGLVFCLVAPFVVPDLTPLVAGRWGVLLFTLGVVLTTVTQVFDYAMIGVLRSGVQLWRNIVSSGVKVLALAAAALLSGPAHVVALLIFSTWTLGHLVSLATVGAQLARRGERVAHAPDWARLRALRGTALAHHALNISWQGPVWVFPLLVTAFLGPSQNASFYVAWMIFFLAFKVTESLTTVLYAVNAADVTLLAQKTRFTLRAAFALSALACLVLIPLAPFALHVFGAEYAAEATAALRWLLLTTFPLVIKMHFLAVMQVKRQIGRATVYMAAGGVLEIAGAAFGVAWGGLSGLVLGMLAAQLLEAAVMLGPVWATARRSPTSVGTARSSSFD